MDQTRIGSCENGRHHLAWLTASEHDPFAQPPIAYSRLQLIFAGSVTHKQERYIVSSFVSQSLCRFDNDLQSMCHPDGADVGTDKSIFQIPLATKRIDTLDLIRELENLGYQRHQDIRYVEVQDGEHNPETWAGVMPDFLKWAFGDPIDRILP